MGHYPAYALAASPRARAGSATECGRIFGMSREPMSDAAWSAHRSYADWVSGRIKLVESAADDAESIEEWFVESSGTAWEPD